VPTTLTCGDALLESPPLPLPLAYNSARSAAQVNPLFNGCHSDSGYTHQPRGLYAQMVLGESFEGLGPKVEI
jgi:hypothetical protein